MILGMIPICVEYGLDGPLMFATVSFQDGYIPISEIQCRVVRSKSTYSLHDNATSMSHNPLWLHLILPTSLNIFTSRWLYEYNYTDCTSNNHCSINVY